MTSMADWINKINILPGGISEMLLQAGSYFLKACTLNSNYILIPFPKSAGIQPL